jgi:hypothetical protein
MRNAMAAACRRAVLVSLAQASASYQPASYEDAAALRTSLAAVLDIEITAAGDAGEDATYSALKTLRSASVQDLTARGASLPSIVTVVLHVQLPSLAIAQLLYRDASRSDEIAAQAGAVHPAFCPVTFQALASGMAASVNPTVPATSGDASGIPVGATPSVGAYQLPPPGMALGLSVVSSTGSVVVLSWSPATVGGLAASYTVQFSVHGAGIWTTAGTVTPPATCYAVTGLAGSSTYDFQVLAINAAGTGSPSALATASTLMSAPNAATAIGATTGSPDSNHDAATGYNLRYSLHAANSWTTVSGVTSGTIITGLSPGASYDLQIQGTNGSTTSPGAWSATTTASTYASTIAWGNSGAPQTTGYTHGSGNINGVNNVGTNANTSPNPSTVYFATSTTNAAVPTTGLISITNYGSPYHWAAYLPVPAIAGTYYLWVLAENGGVIVGGLVSSAITVA